MTKKLLSIFTKNHAFAYFQLASNGFKKVCVYFSDKRMASNKEDIDSNNNSPSHSPSKPNNLLTVMPAVASVSTPNKLLSPLSLTPRKKIFPPLINPISPKLIRERAASKASEKLMKSVTENRLLNEVIELKGELNDARLKLEEYLAENSKLRNGNSENQKMIQEKNDEIKDVKAKSMESHNGKKE